MTNWPAQKELILETERLRLRPITLDDIPLIYFLRSDKTVNQFLKRDLMLDENTAKIFIKDLLQLFKMEQILYWVIAHQVTKESIGTICLWNFTPDRLQAEVGYEMKPDFHGQGLMGEALNHVLGYGEKELGLQRIVAYTQGNNSASIRMLEKADFTFMPEVHDKNNPLNKVFGIDL
ncbi:MAG: GNAT family N-acetyltransferase [Bacteroidota bacterium]